MKKPQKLSPSQLCPNCDVCLFTFTSTEEVETFIEGLGQERALESLEFGIEIERSNYHLYAMGPPGIGKRTIIEKYLKKIAINKPTPSDWCYVYNFANHHQPLALQLPAGIAKKLKHDMTALIEQLLFSIPATFESEEFNSRVQQIEKEYKKIEEKALNTLQQEADKEHLDIVKTSTGYSVVLTKDGEVMSQEEIDALSAKERKRREKAAYKLRDELSELLATMPQWFKERHQKRKEIENEFCTRVVEHHISYLKKEYGELPRVIGYLNSVQQDIIADPKDFLKKEEGLTVSSGLAVMENRSLTRYQINVLVENAATQGAPVVIETNPNYPNLMGKIEYEVKLGALIPNFTLIKPGALHKANGGYLIINLSKVLNHAEAWEGLKRALLTQKIVLDSLGQKIESGTTLLEPEPIPINVKVILIGNHFIYDLISLYDHEFKKLFKVAVDFEDHIKRTPETTQHYGELIAKIIKENELLPFNCDAVGKVIDQCIRLTGHAERITLHMQSIIDLLYEAHYWAKKAGKNIVQDRDVRQAIDAGIKRVDKIRQLFYEEIGNNTIFIDVGGEAIGQINALSIVEFYNFAFGHPSRVTAVTRRGKGKVLDIERETKLGLSLHSKGMLILSGFIQGRYAKEDQLLLSASLVFEQSYGTIDGDSASVAELCALLSSLAELPIKQCFGVTGSINQHGQVQAIGMVNQKIEGFFDICKMKGLTGEQGVLIPAANIQHLMLRQDVVEAVAKNEFNIYPIETIDEAISLLTATPAGERDKHGNYPPNTVNYRCEATLQKYAGLRKIAK